MWYFLLINGYHILFLVFHISGMDSIVYVCFCWSRSAYSTHKHYSISKVECCVKALDMVLVFIVFLHSVFIPPFATLYSVQFLLEMSTRMDSEKPLQVYNIFRSLCLCMHNKYENLVHSGCIFYWMNVNSLLYGRLCMTMSIAKYSVTAHDFWNMLA